MIMNRVPLKELKGKLVTLGEHAYQIKTATLNGVVLHGLDKGAGEITFPCSGFYDRLNDSREGQKITFIDKMFFNIDVTRISEQTHTFRVEATNLEQAKSKAYTQALDTDFGRGTTISYVIERV